MKTASATHVGGRPSAREDTAHHTQEEKIMRRMMNAPIGMTALVSALVGCAVESTGDESTPDEVIPAGYAEALYADYAAASALPDGQLGVRLDVRALAAGALDELAGRNLEGIVGLPPYQVKASDGAVTISDARFSALDLAEAELGDLAWTVDGFDDAGFPVAEGRYRKLNVTVSIGADTRSHHAVEFCWSSLGHCVVFDPAIEFLDSIVKGQRQLKAEGWGPRVEVELRRASPDDGVSLAVCGLASYPTAVARWRNWSAYSRSYANIAGLTMVSKSIGAQQSGLRCNSSCYPAPFGYSNASNGWANIPFRLDCGNKFVQGVTGRSGKFEAETKCSHGLTFDVKADATVQGYGASITVNWNTVGSVDSNGGAFLDTCGYF